MVSAASCPRAGAVGEHAFQGLDHFLHAALAPSGHGSLAGAIAIQRRLTLQREAILRFHQIKVTGVARQNDGQAAGHAFHGDQVRAALTPVGKHRHVHSPKD
jgi:hypothetical protein